MSQNEIFFSYAWKGASEAIVDRLCVELADRGHTVRRDKSTMTYKDSIKAFMDRIGRGKFIIAVVNDKYMKSEYCMYEAFRMFQSPAFSDRVFPIVLPDADVFSFRGQAAYLKYWDQAYRELESEYREIAESSPTMVAPLTERLRDIETTTRFINDFMAAVGDMNVLTSDMHLESNFSQLIESIEQRMNLGDTGAGPVQSDPAETRSASPTTGGGVYIGGNVHTGGGDFIGRDKISVTHTGSPQRSDPFAGIYRLVETRASLSKDDRADLVAEIKDLEAEYHEASEASEEYLERRFRNIKRISPGLLGEILDQILSRAGSPGNPVVRVAAKLKAAG